VLEGSVRRSGSKVRVNAQLIDGESDARLWAGQFDGDMSDLFAQQNEIANRIAVALHQELMAAEVSRPECKSRRARIPSTGAGRILEATIARTAR
jgi:hypothetical protein